MSTKSFIACLTLLLVVGTAIPQFTDNARGGQPILPGGRAAKIRSYSATLNDGGVIIPFVEGTNGFIITDIVAWTDINNTQSLHLLQSGTSRIRINYATTGQGSAFQPPMSFHFQSGIVLAPAEEVTIDLSNDLGEVSIFLSGYTF